MAGESAREEARRAREKAERLARRAEMFEKGADGEAATAATLRDLPPEWGVLHDRRWPLRRLANIDHIVIGPGGIFVIDSKNWSGRLTLGAGHLRQNGRSREKEVAKCADAGLAVAELAGPFGDRVFPVLCFTRDEPLTGWSRDVLICSTSTLTQMLLSRPQALTAAEATEVWLRLDVHLRSALAPPETERVRRIPTDTRARRPARGPGSTVRSRRAAQRRRRGLRQFVLSLAALAAFVGFGPQLASAVGGILAERLSSSLAACDDGTPSGTGAAAARRGGQAGAATEGGDKPQQWRHTGTTSGDDC